MKWILSVNNPVTKVVSALWISKQQLLVKLKQNLTEAEEVKEFHKIKIRALSGNST